MTMLTISVLLSFISLQCLVNSTSLSQIYDTLYHDNNHTILELPQTQDSCYYWDECEQKHCLHKMKYKYGSVALKEHLRDHYWNAYEKERKLWSFRSRLFYFIYFDNNYKIKNIIIWNYQIKNNSENESLKHFFKEFERVIKEALKKTEGDWIPQREPQNNWEHYYFGIF